MRSWLMHIFKVREKHLISPSEIQILVKYLDLAEQTLDPFPGGTVTGSYKPLWFPFFPTKLR